MQFGVFWIGLRAYAAAMCLNLTTHVLSLLRLWLRRFWVPFLVSFYAQAQTQTQGTTYKK